MLPILALDEQAIRPPLGYWFDRRWIDPYESLVTILWKFARANSIPGHLLARKVCGSGVDPYYGILPLRELVQWRWLHREHRIPRKALQESMVGTSRQSALSPDLRFCRRCLCRGYQATIFQLVSVTRCPIHDERLLDACQYCDFRIPFRLNALVLDSPYICPACHWRLAGQIPTVSQLRPMQMPARICITRKRLTQHLS
jgi:hypothetical protein